MNRSPEHVFQFMMAELSTEGSIDGLQRLVIKGKFLPKVPPYIFISERFHDNIFQYIESLLRKYVGDYVTCKMCRSFSTSLTRDSVSRLYFVHCQVSTRSIQVYVPVDPRD